MISRCLTLIVLFSMLMFSSVADAKNKQQYSSSMTLGDYIHAHCKVGCAGQEEILKSVMGVASKLDIDFKDLLTIMKVESSFKPKARSGSNAGLMQVNLKYHRKKFKGRNPYNVQANIEVGGSIYKDCLDKNDNNRFKSMNCYNGSGDRKYVAKIKKATKEVENIKFEKEEDMPINVRIISRPDEATPVDMGIATELERIGPNAYKGLSVRYRSGLKWYQASETLPEMEEELGWQVVMVMEDDSILPIVGGHSKKSGEEQMGRILALLKL